MSFEKNETVKSGFNGILSSIEGVLMFFSCVGLVVMTALISLDTIFRYFLHKPIIGVMEITTTYLMIGIVFLALSYAYREKGLIRIEFIVMRLPKIVLKCLNIIFNIITVVLFSVIGLQAWKLAYAALQMNQLSIGILELPMAPAYFLVVIGSLILCLRLCFETFTLLLSNKEGD